MFDVHPAFRAPTNQITDQGHAYYVDLVHFWITLAQVSLPSASNVQLVLNQQRGADQLQIVFVLLDIKEVLSPRQILFSKCAIPVVKDITSLSTARLSVYRASKGNMVMWVALLNAVHVLSIRKRMKLEGLGSQTVYAMQDIFGLATPVQHVFQAHSRHRLALMLAPSVNLGNIPTTPPH